MDFCHFQECWRDFEFGEGRFQKDSLKIFVPSTIRDQGWNGSLVVGSTLYFCWWNCWHANWRYRHEKILGLLMQPKSSNTPFFSIHYHQHCWCHLSLSPLNYTISTTRTHETNNSLTPKTSIMNFVEVNNVSKYVITSNIWQSRKEKTRGLEQDKSKAQM